MLIGYARVSTDDQNLDLQNDALEAAGCDRVYRDKASGVRPERPGLKRALEDIRAGDTLVVWRLDRLGRSLKDLIARAEALEAQVAERERDARERMIETRLADLQARIVDKDALIESLQRELESRSCEAAMSDDGAPRR